MFRGSHPPISIRILHLEDDPGDAELIRELLLAEWGNCLLERVTTEGEFTAALLRGEVDVILSDFSLPGFNGLAALALARKYRPEAPFIFLSGTIGEEHAVEALRHGATDYVLKDRPVRLAAAIRRALADTDEHRMRRAAEQRLREQAELLDKARDAILVRDLEDRVVYWNRSAERIFGYSAAEALGRRTVELMGKGTEVAPFVEASRRLLETGEWTGEIRGVTKTGEFLDIMASWTVLRDDEGRPARVLCIDTDITEQKRLERQYMRAQRMESLGTLAGGIAHDLNNVLAPILMAVEIIRARTTDDETRQMLEILAASARHGADLVRQVLAFARGAEGTHRQFQPGAILREVARLLGETLPRSIAIDTEVGPDLWLVNGDATQFNQVLMNLGVNARDAMPQGGRLRMRAENVGVDEALARSQTGARPGPHVKVTVADTGTGIPPALIERIFDPFFTTKEPGRGTGLGLATVLGIVKGHKGFLQVQSEVGRGTEFRIYFPAAPAAVERPAEPLRPAMPPGEGELILVIDDEESIRATARALLEAFGYQTITVNDGRSGVELYRQRHREIDAVLTDMMMPGMQGPEVVAALRAIDPDLGVVAMSGLPEAENPALRPEAGRLELLRKPMSGDELLRAIRSVLGRGSPGA